MKKVINLRPRYGNCVGEWDYVHYSTRDYSRSKCKMDLKTSHVVNNCGCRDSYMPSPNEDEFCSLRDYQNCAATETSERDIKC